jgi:formate hydrogenlyase subunit 6/NADH:ubiquinone oxidoreductase subunit I
LEEEELRLERYGMGIAKGMALTLKHLFRKNVTTQYPEKRLEVSRRTRGQQFVWRVDLCTGCATCAKTCPHGIIRIKTSTNGENRYIVDEIDFDTGRCMYCGLCVEACPYNALFMGRSYEQAQYSKILIYADKEVLMAPSEEEVSAYGHPELEEKLPKQTLLVYGQISRETAPKEND